MYLNKTKVPDEMRSTFYTFIASGEDSSFLIQTRFTRIQKPQILQTYFFYILQIYTLKYFQY